MAVCEGIDTMTNYAKSSRNTGKPYPVEDWMHLSIGSAARALLTPGVAAGKVGIPAITFKKWVSERCLEPEEVCRKVHPAHAGHSLARTYLRELAGAAEANRKELTPSQLDAAGRDALRIVEATGNLEEVAALSGGNQLLVPVVDEHGVVKQVPPSAAEEGERK